MSLKRIAPLVAVLSLIQAAPQAQMDTSLFAGLHWRSIGPSRGGVAAAELRQRRCTGCQLEINAADLRAFSAAPEDEVLRCEECGRILIRTPQSGLAQPGLAKSGT